MSNFDNGAPNNPYSWTMGGYDITPCNNKRPVLANWQKRTISLEQWEKHYSGFQIGLKLTGLVDFDIDNHFIKRFVEKYLCSSGAAYGRKSNPLSHYLFEEELESKKFVLPKELESYYKDFPHGACLCEIRSGSGHQSIVPGSEINNEAVEWNKYSGIKKYNGNLQEDISKIALSGALRMLYPSKGSRDTYCTAIAGVLANHTDWNEDAINEFVHNLALFSNDENHRKKMSKGTNAKNPKTKNLGLPTIAQVVGGKNFPVSVIAQIFSWVGVKDSGSSFTELKVYETEPKYWQLKYKDTWITIMDSSILLSYTKVSILILENCYEVAPVVSPKDWKRIVADLLKNVQKIEAPHEASYYGNIGSVFIHMITNASGSSDKTNLGMFKIGVWLNPEDNHYYFRLENLIETLKRKQLSFEMRKMTHWLREQFEACPTKVAVDKKELRVWKVAKDVIDKHELNNLDVKGSLKKIKQRLAATSYKNPEPF